MQLLTRLPKGFPEYSIMYRTLKNQIKELEKQQTSNEKESNENKSKIHQYETMPAATSKEEVHERIQCSSSF